VDAIFTLPLYINIQGNFKALNIVSDLEKLIIIAEIELLSKISVDIFEFENCLIRKETK
jgi:hypothetical protein